MPPKSALKKSDSVKVEGKRKKGVRFNPDVDVAVFDKTLSSKSVSRLQIINPKDKDARGPTAVVEHKTLVRAIDEEARDSLAAAVHGALSPVSSVDHKSVPLESALKGGGEVAARADEDHPDLASAVSSPMSPGREAKTLGESLWGRVSNYLYSAWKNVTRALDYVANAVFSGRDNSSVSSAKTASTDNARGSATEESRLLRETDGATVDPTSSVKPSPVPRPLGVRHKSPVR